jgi:hypothetical protein
MVLNTTFINISAISWRSVLLVEETGGPGENHREQDKQKYNGIDKYINSIYKNKIYKK